MAYDENDNDGRFPDDSRVEVRYPHTRQEEHGDRAEWPWLPGRIVEQCGRVSGGCAFRRAGDAEVGDSAST